VLDLAAGTGKLTRALLAWGLDVTAVEPTESMRAVLSDIVGAERVIDGVAEEIPAEDDSFAAVTVADGFHWFDPQPALAEIRRALRPGGALAILAMVPDWSGASWAAELGAMLERLRPEHPFFDGPGWQQQVATAGGWSEPWQVRVTVSQPARDEQIVDWLQSMSWIAAMPDDQRATVIDEVRSLIEAGETPDELRVISTIGMTRLLQG
jgi:SAM-dependent methyltransferase